MVDRMKDEPKNISTMRNTIKIFMRSLGVLEGKKAFCYNCTYAHCHVIWETAQESQISVNELATRLNITKSAASRTVDDLVKKGYLKRNPNSNDRRYVDIELMEKGHQTHYRMKFNYSTHTLSRSHLANSQSIYHHHKQLSCPLM